VVLTAGVGLAFGLRSYSESLIPTVSENGILAVSLSSLPRADVARLLQVSRENPEVSRLMGKYHNQPQHTLVAYIVPQNYMMQHLIADLGEHEAHHGEGERGGALAVLKHLGQMYLLKPLRQLRDGRWSRENRIIFTEALTSQGNTVLTEQALGVEVFRYPIFFADLKGTEVTLTMEVPRRHAWGNIPVPAF
jgi:hypothetical protein